MNITLLSRFRILFARYDWTPAQRRNYCRQWARSFRALGDKALIATQVSKAGARS